MFWEKRGGFDASDVYLIKKKTYNASGKKAKSQSNTVAKRLFFPLYPLNTLNTTKARPTSSVFVYIKDVKNTGMLAMLNNKPMIIMGILKNDIQDNANAIEKRISKNKYIKLR
jgi:hypothetical protein